MHPRAAERPATAWRHALSALALLLLAACGTVPQPGAPPAGDVQRDGPPANPPPDLISRPDPEPKVEPLRSGGPNKPYEVLGQRYTPLAADAPVFETGLASWYGRKFHGRPTASGEIYDMYASTGAHRTMPIPSYALVRNPRNGREVVVRINDRGPFHSDRIVDLSYAAALKLDVLRGVAPVEVRRLTHEDIRTGRWRGESAWARAEAQPLPGAVEAAKVPPAPQTPLINVAATPADGATAASAPAAAAPGFWVQLGAFRQRQAAHDLRDLLARELAWLEPWLAILDDRALYRLQAGPYASRLEAQGAAERIRGAVSVQPMVVQRR
jgi:rare lipoprotein A